MFRALILGILLGVLLVGAGVYFYFSTGPCTGGGYGFADAIRTESSRIWG